MLQIAQPPRTLRTCGFAAPLGAWVAACLSAGSAHAAVVDIRPYAQYNWESDHNPFLAPDANSGATLVTRPNVDDKVSTLVAGLNLKHDAADTSTYVTGEGRRVAYSTYDTFNHTEYAATLGHKRGAVGRSQFGIEFGAARQYTAYDILAANTPVAYQTRRYGRINGVLRVAERNIFDATFDRIYLRLPIAGASNFNTVESDLQVGYGRLIGAAATVGVRAIGVTGSNYFGGVTTPYKQLTPGLFINYNRPGILQIDAGIGATHRTQEGSAGMKATVGNANLRYELTAKTAVRLRVQRQVSGYYVVAGSQTTTAYSAGIDWRPTDRLSLSLDAGRTHGLYAFPQSAASRTDDTDLSQLTVSWKAARWLAISAFGLVQKRASTSVDYRFDASSVGISAKVQRP